MKKVEIKHWLSAKWNDYFNLNQKTVNIVDIFFVCFFKKKDLQTK